MLAAALLRRRSGAVSIATIPKLFLFRNMGGGPRTFPGGLSKWKYRRMHEKLAREKERKLLQQEKELYQARLRSEIRASISGGPPPGDGCPALEYGPMSSKDHIKALADRFVRPGAEDLWNEDDGPVTASTSDMPLPLVVRPSASSLPDSKKPSVDRRNLADHTHTNAWRQVESFYQSRGFSVLARRGMPRLNPVPDAGTDSSYGASDDYLRRRNGALSSEEEVKFGFGSWKDKTKEPMSSAALGNYDKKITKRVPFHLLEKITSQQEIDSIREALQNRRATAEGLQKAAAEPVFSEKRFDEYNISPLTIKALALAGYELLTVVQGAALPICLSGIDALVKAKSGLGKTLSFLLPVIETVLTASSLPANKRLPPIFALILCPTRELASQISAEARILLKHHDGIGVQTLTGGTRFKVDQKLLESSPSQIVVATPGRLLDHIENKSGLSARLMGLKILVIDEADHLLDLGFQSDIEKIVDTVPRQRQSLVFSATVQKEVRRISQLVLKREHAFVDTVGLGSPETNLKVTQTYIVAPHEVHFEMAHQILNKHILENIEYKIIVFCATAMMTEMMYVFLRHMNINARQLHTRKPQLYRSRISDEFRESKRLVLVTSDVSAHGMDYPGVTLVLQVGIPMDRKQYIHRIGRTGRLGKDGKSILLLAPWEEYFVDEISDLPVERSPLPATDSNMRLQAEEAMQKIDVGTKEAAYHAWLGYYNSISRIGRDKTALVEMANKFCTCVGLERPPELLRRTAIKMGLKGIVGIRIKK